jgi:hypothetical protein
LVAGACGSSAATAGPALSKTVSFAPTASSAPAVSASPNADNILASAIDKSSDIKSFHLAVTIDGSLNENMLASAMGGADSTGAQASLPSLSLDGTTISGDVDVANRALHLNLAVPAFALTGEVIVVGGNAYYRTSLSGSKLFTMTSMSDADLPLESASPEAIASMSLGDGLSQIRAALESAGITVSLVGVEQIAGRPADHFSLTLPLAKMNSDLATQEAAKITLTSATADFWLYTADSTMAQIKLTADAGSAGSLAVTVTLSAYNVPVSITAPPANQIQATQ